MVSGGMSGIRLGVRERERRTRVRNQLDALRDQDAIVGELLDALDDGMPLSVHGDQQRVSRVLTAIQALQRLRVSEET